MTRFKYRLIASVSVALVAALIGVAPALATEYRCFKAATCNGKDETIDTVIARNESGTGLVGRLWKNNGGGNYAEDGKSFCSGCTEVKPATPGFAHINGHAETERWFKEFTYTLSGFEYVE